MGDTARTSTAWQRTHTCGELRAEHVGEAVTLNGWVHGRRDLGGIYFLDLRDRYGLTQVVLSPELSESVRIGTEYVLSVRGAVAAREDQNVNRDLPTGAIEVLAESVEVLAPAETPPFEIESEHEAAVETRLRYRYIDLRRAPLQRNLAHRSRFVSALRRAFEAQDFLEIETPILTRATPEGARDYLVPSRVHPGSFYALPQSPQIFKQILMVSGYDRYFQVARCFRDEDLRADRQPEFTQLDMEMSFVDEEGVFATWERALAETFREALDVDLQTPFPRMTWDEAMERFGSDKPDLRFGLELVDVAPWAASCEFGVFRSALEAGGRVMALVVPAAHALSRKDLAGLEELAKTHGAQGLAWWRAAADGGAGPLKRFAGDEASATALMETLGAGEGDLALFMAGDAALVRGTLGELRLHLGRRFDLVDSSKRAFLWVTSFPMFEWDAESERWFSSHHPFTAPADWEMEGDPGSLASRAYDLVLDGWELGSGSVRIHRADVQRRVFERLGIGEEEASSKFGFLLEALSFGAPPHAGFALGLDRIVALTAGLDSIRDVVAFPKTTSATDLMCQAPSPVADEQLAEVHVRSRAPRP